MNFSELNFNKEQHEAVVFSLYHIARDEQVELSRVKSLFKTFVDKVNSNLERLNGSEPNFKNASAQVRALKSFNDKQKEWFVKKSLVLLKSSESVVKNEFSIANGFYKAMGLKQEDLIRSMMA